MRNLLLLMIGLFLPITSLARPAEVVVLATLHQMHSEVPAYGFDELRKTIIRLSPDVLCMEVSKHNFTARTDEGVKVEYPRTVYPLLDEKGYEFCALEPDVDVAAKIIEPYVAANQAFARARPEAHAAFGAYSDAMYALLKQHWRSAAAVNDHVTDQVLGAKHDIQAALIGEGERTGWEAWNRHFLQRILDAAKPAKRVVVLVGVEHGYWLRRELANQESVVLLDTAEILR